MHAPHFSPPHELPPTRGFGFYFVLMLVTASALGAFWMGMQPKKAQLERAREVGKELAAVRVRTVSPVSSPEGNELSLSGELKPVMEASILARVGGYVQHWHADLGDSVKAGQLLAELDTPELQRELARARAQLSLAEAARNLADKTARRWQELLAARTASTQEADEKAADFQLKIAAVEAARAEVQRLEQIASFSKITAPFEGTIVARGIDLGQLVEAGGQKELYRLADLRKLRVFVRVPQSHARSLSAGQDAEIRVPELHGRVFPARVVRMAGAFDAASRTLLAELEADNAEGRLIAGGYVQVRLAGAHAEVPLTVPATSLIFRAEGAQVAVIDDQGVAHFRKVQLGRDLGTMVQVLEGVSAQDSVVLNPPDALTDGTRVERSP